MAQTTEDVKPAAQQTSGPGQGVKPEVKPEVKAEAPKPAAPVAPKPTAPAVVKAGGPAFVHVKVKRGLQINEGGRTLASGQSFLTTPARAKQLAAFVDVVGDATPSVVTSGAPTSVVK